MLKEHEFHMSLPIRRVIYCSKEEEEGLSDLKSHFELKGTDARFLKKIPSDLLSMIIPSATVIVFDDFLPAFSSDRALNNLLFSLATIHVRHRSIFLFFASQSTEILKKSHKLNLCVSQSTHYVCFRTLTEGKTLKRFLSNFSLNLKDDVTLSEVYDRHIMTRQYSYLILSVGPGCPRNSAYSNILVNEPGFMLTFDKSDDESDLPEG